MSSNGLFWRAWCVPQPCAASTGNHYTFSLLQAKRRLEKGSGELASLIASACAAEPDAACKVSVQVPLLDAAIHANESYASTGNRCWGVIS